MAPGRGGETGVERRRQILPRHEFRCREGFPARRRERVVPKYGAESVALLTGVNDDSHGGGNRPSVTRHGRRCRRRGRRR